MRRGTVSLASIPGVAFNFLCLKRQFRRFPMLAELGVKFIEFGLAFTAIGILHHDYLR
jgi:hypothetical protein